MDDGGLNWDGGGFGRDFEISWGDTSSIRGMGLCWLGLGYLGPVLLLGLCSWGYGAERSTCGGGETRGGLDILWGELCDCPLRLFMDVDRVHIMQLY